MSVLEAEVVNVLGESDDDSELLDSDLVSFDVDVELLESCELELDEEVVSDVVVVVVSDFEVGVVIVVQWPDDQLDTSCILSDSSN